MDYQAEYMIPREGRMWLLKNGVKTLDLMVRPLKLYNSARPSLDPNMDYAGLTNYISAFHASPEKTLDKDNWTVSRADDGSAKALYAKQTWTWATGDTVEDICGFAIYYTTGGETPTYTLIAYALFLNGQHQNFAINGQRIQFTPWLSHSGASIAGTVYMEPDEGEQYILSYGLENDDLLCRPLKLKNLTDRPALTPAMNYASLADYLATSPDTGVPTTLDKDEWTVEIGTGAYNGKAKAYQGIQNYDWVSGTEKICGHAVYHDEGGSVYTLLWVELLPQGDEISMSEAGDQDSYVPTFYFYPKTGV